MHNHDAVVRAMNSDEPNALVGLVVFTIAVVVGISICLFDTVVCLLQTCRFAFTTCAQKALARASRDDALTAVFPGAPTPHTSAFPLKPSLD